jgi:hypothetical protein
MSLIVKIQFKSTIDNQSYIAQREASFNGHAWRYVRADVFLVISPLNSLEFIRFFFLSYPYPTKWGRYNMIFNHVVNRFGNYFYDRPPA